jgi:hypothetical protein
MAYAVVRRRAQFSFERMKFIVLESDPTLAIFMLGWCCILWGMVGLVHQADLAWYAQGFAFEFAPWIWGFNSIGFGIALIHLSVVGLLPGRSLVIGFYGIFIFMWVMMSRPNSSLSSGVVLNGIIIFMSGVIIQRSGRVRT